MLIKKYTSDWIAHFADLKHEIDKGLNGIDYGMEHIGSTAVLGLDANPIIDIDIIYKSESDFEKIKSGLLKLGYYHNGNQGLENREVFKRNGEPFNKVLDTVTHHLYVCAADSEALQRHLLFRDFLRKHQWARINYQKIKYDLAEKANQDKKHYAKLKELHLNDFIEDIIKIGKV